MTRKYCDRCGVQGKINTLGTITHSFEYTSGTSKTYHDLCEKCSWSLMACINNFCNFVPPEKIDTPKEDSKWWSLTNK